MGLSISAADESWIRAHANVQWYWTGSPEAPTAYAAFGRGMDLPNMVHEWGGDQWELRSIFKRICERNPAAELLANAKLLYDFGFPAALGDLEYLCMSKILNPEALLRKSNILSELSFNRVEHGWTMSRKDQAEISMTEFELAKLLMGPTELNQQHKGILLPIWFWGLDSA